MYLNNDRGIVPSGGPQHGVADMVRTCSLHCILNCYEEHCLSASVRVESASDESSTS